MLVAADFRNYHIEMTLARGTSLDICAMRPADKARLVEYFGRLSPDSHYRRFCGFRKAFTPEELHHMTNPKSLNTRLLLQRFVTAKGKNTLWGRASTSPRLMDDVPNSL